MRRMWIFAALAALLLSGCGAKTQASEPWEELGVSRGCLDGHRGLFGALFRPGRGRSAL